LRKQWHIITLWRVYHRHRRISSAVGCIRFRNDDIQHSVLMICNFYEIDDIQGYRLDFLCYIKPTDKIDKIVELDRCSLIQLEEIDDDIAAVKRYISYNIDFDTFFICANEKNLAFLPCLCYTGIEMKYITFNERAMKRKYKVSHWN